ncbi:MAG: malto-oligosyltrehalose synthase [Fibrobacter sp.]|nr:malto-oligosyltrehalose synthase [Fibrobacter sp.]
MNTPVATYRLQFSQDFTFENAVYIVTYLKKLGISHIYASPIFKARKGSPHGYDVADPRIINPELGGKNAFDALQGICASNGIGWIQDIVPNHMTLSSDNPFLVDICENGSLSEYYSLFDIEWDHPNAALKGKLIIPILGNLFGKCLEAGELKLEFISTGLWITYYDHRFPLRLESYSAVFSRCTDMLRDVLGDSNPDFLKFLGVLYTVKNLPGTNDIKERYEQIGFIKTLLWEMYSGNAIIRQICDQVISTCNGNGSESDRWALLESILSEQYFRLAFWKTATQELNYRRFFTVNDLIAVRVEDESVFNVTHELIGSLVQENKIQGLRVDHIDGLYDPAIYCERLRQLAPDAYIVVEKILAEHEELPEAWGMQGTTGYDFLNTVNRLFCNCSGQRAIDRTYGTISEDKRTFKELVADKKRLIIGRHMAGDIDNLALRLKALAGKDRQGIDITMYGLRRALVEVLTFFPVYRSYITEKDLTSTDWLVLKKALDDSRLSRDEFVPELDYIEAFLGLDTNASSSSQEFIERRRFIMRLQQFTGPLLAKGIEDTALYSYNRLVSLNEVGGHPELFGICKTDFHTFCSRRADHYPHAMNATATHDTKRGEGTRVRINVISELGTEWFQQVRRWHVINQNALTMDENGKQMPVLNDEYLFYQTIIGSFPVESDNLDFFRSRIEEYMLKAAREAKIHSSWIRPNEAYENALKNFVNTALSDSAKNSFLTEFIPFQKKIAWYGMLNSLSQTTIKITAPGIPDFYQGTELWDFSLVDPDNRRPVDFEQRIRVLDELNKRENDPLLLKELIATPQNGTINLFLIKKLLHFRNKLPELFSSGKYIPVDIIGIYADSIVAFLRTTPESACLVVVPRMLTKIIAEGTMPLTNTIWDDTSIQLPPEYSGKTWFDIVTNTTLDTKSTTMSIGDILTQFPVSVLELLPERLMTHKK